VGRKDATASPVRCACILARARRRGADNLRTDTGVLSEFSAHGVSPVLGILVPT
jgi:hypothetical protein